MIKKQVKDFVINFNNAIKFFKNHSELDPSHNFNKKIKNYKVIISLLELLPENDILSADAIPYNDKQEAFEIANIGGLIEQIIDKFLRKVWVTETSQKKAGKVDSRSQFGCFEVKASVTSYSVCTKVKPNKSNKYKKTILINSRGLWLIPADMVPQLLNAKSRFDYNECRGISIKDYDEKMFQAVQPIYDAMSWMWNK